MLPALARLSWRTILRGCSSDRIAHLLTWQRARVYSLGLGFVLLFAWVHSVVSGSAPLNGAGQPIGGDYIAFYAAGRLVVSSRASEMYDAATLSQLQRDVLGLTTQNFYDAYRNPPFFALVFAPLALLDLLPSLLIWSVLSVACLAVAIWLALADARWLEARWRGLAAIVFAFGPVYFGLIDGENATLSLLLYVLIYRALCRGQEGWAGVWAALGLFKPQLFFVFPLVFVASGRWRALRSYAATSLVLAAISFMLVGLDGLFAWQHILLGFETQNATRNAWRMHSLKGFTDALLPRSPGLSLIWYAVLSVPLLACVLRLWRQTRLARPDPVLWALTCVVAVLVDPHLVDYDLTVLVTAGIAALPGVPRLRWLVVLLYPLLVVRAQVPLGQSALQLSTLCLAMCCIVLLHHLGVRLPAFRHTRAPLPASRHLG